jgi:hypothetical protein
MSNPIPYSKTREYRRDQSRKWRLSHGSITVRGLVLVCRECGNEFSPKNSRALSCSITCAKAYNKRTRIRPVGDARREERLAHKHKWSADGYKKELELQKGVCKLCKEPFSYSQRSLFPCIDHDHNCCKTNSSCGKCRRGIIHSRCNLMLGHSEDRLDLLKLACIYLEGHRNAV